MTPGSPLPPPPDLRGAFHTAPSAVGAYAEVSGPFRLPAAAVAVPADAADVERLVSWAAAGGVPLVPRGAGTGMPAGNVGPGVLLDLQGLRWIEPPDPEAATLRCGAGAIAADVARAAAAAGLYFPPLPSSAERCTIGGMVANNAAGARSFRHGSVREWVVALEVVWADGTRSLVERGRTPAWAGELAAAVGARTGAPPRAWPAVRKNSSGYALDRFLPDGDALQLLVGSEGTLGVVVAVTLRLIPHPPARGVLLVGLPHLDAVPAAAAEAERVSASACEMFGRRLVEMARLEGDSWIGDSARGAEALVLFEVEGDPERVEDGLSRLRRWATEAGTACAGGTGEEERARLWEVRHAASPLIARAAARGLLSTQFIEDSVVPPARVPEYVRGLERILERAELDAVVFGHAGDGNLHVNPLLDPGTPDWRGRVRTVLEETVVLVAALGGTLSGEHGDGRLRAPLLDRIWPAPLVDGFRHIKRALDPEGILNPGVILPLPGQDPLAGLWPDRP